MIANIEGCKSRIFLLAVRKQVDPWIGTCRPRKHGSWAGSQDSVAAHPLMKIEAGRRELPAEVHPSPEHS